MPTTVEILAERLAAAGCRHAFGVPGGEVLALMDALDRAGIGFRLVKHENAGAFMAEGSWHMTGAPGVLVATIGPGLANAMNAALNALQDQVPLILLSGGMDPAAAETYTHQVTDQVALMAPVVKKSWRLADGAVDAIVDKAIATAMADPQGPVHIDIPVSLATAEQPAPAPSRTPPAAPMAPAPGPALEAARAMLAEAERPIMVAGVGALAHGAETTVAETCRALGVPLVTTYKAKGVLAEDDPLCLGGHGLSPKSDAIVLPLLAEADCVVTVGYDPIEMRAGWRDPWAPARCVALDHLPNRHGMHGAAVSFVGDVGAGLRALTEGLAPNRPLWPGGAPAAARAALDAAFSAEGWGPHAALAAARRALSEDGVATVDSGAHRILMSQAWRCFRPRTLLQSTGFCTMGVALPLAIGAKVAAPARAVLAVMGDGGAEMVMGEFATLRDLKRPVVVLILVDESLALIELKQRREGLRNLGVDFSGTDWPAFAAAMGGIGVLAEDAETVERAVREGLARETFTLVAAVIGRGAYDGAF